MGGTVELKKFFQNPSAKTHETAGSPSNLQFQFLPARSEAAPRGKASGTQAASRPNVKSGRSSRSGTCCPQRFVSHL